MMRKCVAALAAGGLVVGLAFAADPIKIEAKSFEIKSAFENSTEGVQFVEADGRVAFYTNGTAKSEIDVPADGEYTITIEAACDAAKEVNAKFKLSVGADVIAKEHTLTSTEKKEYTFTAKLKKGKVKLVVEFLNDEYKENEYDRNFYLYDAKVEEKKAK